MARTSDPWRKMPQAAAERLLDKIQFNRRAVSMKLKNIPVDVEPLHGNMFRITLDMSLPGAGAAAQRLNDIGSNIKPWPAEKITRADVTWDSTLHYLIMTGDLA